MNKLVIAIVAVLVVFVGWNVVSKGPSKGQPVEPVVNMNLEPLKLGVIVPSTGDVASIGQAA